jgi:hypothetical protein
MTTNTDAFTMNVVHHHHDTVINNDAQINPAQAMLDMMLNFHMLKMLSDGFRGNPMLDSPTEPTKLIGVQPVDETVEYEIVGDEEPLFQIIQPTKNPYYNNKKYYSIYKSVFSSGWKRVIRDMNIETPLAIIILDGVNEVESEPREYIALYNSMPVFTKAMYGKSAPKEQIIPRNWDTAPYFLEALCELEHISKMRGQKFAYYIEELDLTSKRRFASILSNDFPKTEIYEHVSIFSFKPDIVYTNFERNIFRIEFKEDSFVVKRN